MLNMDTLSNIGTWIVGFCLISMIIFIMISTFETKPKAGQKT
jgi:hypothetical protein